MGVSRRLAWIVVLTVGLLACVRASSPSRAAHASPCRRVPVDTSKLNAQIDELVAATHAERQRALRGTSGFAVTLPATFSDDGVAVEQLLGSDDCSTLDARSTRALAMRAVAGLRARVPRGYGEHALRVSIACKAGLVTALCVTGEVEGFHTIVNQAFLVAGARLRSVGPVQLLAVTDLNGDGIADYIGLGNATSTRLGDACDLCGPTEQLRIYWGAKGWWSDVPGLWWSYNPDEGGDSTPLVLLRGKETCVASWSGGVDERLCWDGRKFRRVPTFDDELPGFEDALEQAQRRYGAVRSLGDRRAAFKDLATCARASDDDPECAATLSRIAQSLTDAGAAPSSAKSAVMLAVGRADCPAP